MLSFRTILPDTLELLRRLMAVPELSGTRLVGGTALALQYGHRNSVDLDFFGQFDKGTDFAALLSEVHGCQLRKVTPNIKILEINRIKVDFVNYSYPWIDDTVIEDGIRLASPKDIAAMKINAIEGRGTRKDFVDIYFLLQHHPLEEILGFYKQKYPEHSVFRALMSLMYFEDAELQPMPVMYDDTPWEEMKRYIQREVERIK